MAFGGQPTLAAQSRPCAAGVVPPLCEHRRGQRQLSPSSVQPGPHRVSRQRPIGFRVPTLAATSLGRPTHRLPCTDTCCHVTWTSYRSHVPAMQCTPPSGWSPTAVCSNSVWPLWRAGHHMRRVPAMVVQTLDPLSNFAAAGVASSRLPALLHHHHPYYSSSSLPPRSLTAPAFSHPRPSPARHTSGSF